MRFFISKVLQTLLFLDGKQTKPITINGSPYEPENGDVVIYKPSGLSGDADTEREYVWVEDETNGKWQEFGSTGALKAFAFADTGTVEIPDAGEVKLSTPEQQELMIFLLLLLLHRRVVFNLQKLRMVQKQFVVLQVQVQSLRLNLELMMLMLM